MEVSILAFGISKEIVNSSRLSLKVENAISVGDLKKRLESSYPQLADLQSYMIAVNKAYADDELILKSNDEIAIIPPVSGG